MRPLLILLVAALLTSCSPSALRPPVAAEPAPSPPVPSIPIVVDGPAPALPDFPAPGIPIPQPPYDRSEPHPLPMESLDLPRVASAVGEAAKDWGAPGRFHVNSLWQITNGLQLATGFFDGVMTAGVVTLPSEGRPQFHALPKVGGGGPATIIGMKEHLVLIRTGLTYTVFDSQTRQSHVSDEYGNPGERTVLWRSSITAEAALQIGARLHQPGAALWVWFDRNFMYDHKGESGLRPAWIVQTLSPSPHVRVYVDAVTGEHFRVLQSGAPAPDPIDRGFISRDAAVAYGLSGENATEVRVDLLEGVQIPAPPHGTLEIPIWRIELGSSEGSRPRLLLIDARSGKWVTPGMVSAK